MASETSSSKMHSSDRNNASASNDDERYGKSGSPPNVVVDDSPLQPCLDRNKESLRVKLLLRRPMNLLVEQGILPPPKTPAAFAGQRVRLERARMSDLLKIKIQQRPARQELVGQHILEDTNARVAPSLAEKQRMLKRARLADSLNDHLIHRPGPLELVQKNILHASDSQIEQAIKEGAVDFKPTSEGHVPGPQVPNKYLCGDDESSSDLSSSAENSEQSSLSNKLETSASSTQQETVVKLESPKPFESHYIPLSIDSSVSVPVAPVSGRLQLQLHRNDGSSDVPQPTFRAIIPNLLPVLTDAPGTASTNISSQTNVMTVPVSTSSISVSQNCTSGKTKNSRKLGKAKCIPKARTIKFHEYKGPPNAQKGIHPVQQQTESSYELLLQQQQLFLQWQLEWQHKYPQIILPAAPKVDNNCPLYTKSSGALSSNTALLNKPSVSSFPVLVSKASHTMSYSEVPVSSGASESSIVMTFPSENLSDRSEETVKIRPLKFQNVNEAPPHTDPASSKSKLDDWKVNDLKAELRRRNLPVSGSKPQLIGRLRQANFQLEEVAHQSKTSGSSGVNSDIKTASVEFELSTAKDENSSSTDIMEVTENSDAAEESSKVNGQAATVQPDLLANACSKIEQRATFSVDENLIKEQQQQILQLKNALQNSQYQLQQMKSSQVSEGQKHRIALQHHLQHKRQQQDLQVKLQKLIQLHSLQQKKCSEAKKAGTEEVGSYRHPTTKKSNQAEDSMKNYKVLEPVEPRLGISMEQLGSSMTEQHGQPHNDARASLPVPSSYNPKDMNSADDSWMLKVNVDQNRKVSDDCMSDLLGTIDSLTDDKSVMKMDFDSLLSPEEPIKSQMVDDVLEILIANGELPYSAAHDPNQEHLGNFETGNSGDTHSSNLYDDSMKRRLSLQQDIIPPPPPPLPPSNFSVTLPTAMEVGKNTFNYMLPSYNHHPGLVLEPTSYDNNAVTFFTDSSHSSPKQTPSSGTFQSSAPVNVVKADYSNQDKYENDIESNFSPVTKPDTEKSKCLSLLLDNVGKNLSVVDDMDVALDEPVNQTMLHSAILQQPNAVMSENCHDDMSKVGAFTLDHALLQDLDMPMDMDYEWLDSILPSSSHSVPNPQRVLDTLSDFHNPHASTQPKHSFDNNCNSNVMNNNSERFVSSSIAGMQHNVIGSTAESLSNFNTTLTPHFSRDPLLSSTRSIENSNGVDTTNQIRLSSVNHEQNIDVQSGGESKMGVGSLMSPVGDTALWDFA